jgi:hypothetical protein
MIAPTFTLPSGAWVEHVHAVDDSTSSGVTEMDDGREYELIPTSAAALVAFGALLAVVGFSALWFMDSALPNLSLVVGLLLFTIGMRAAERALRL